MSNEDKEIKAGDLLGVDQAGNIIKVTDQSTSDIIGIAADGLGQQMNDQIDTLFLRTFGYYELQQRVCALCHVEEYIHGNEGEEQHPFFLNNLEYLEWESKQRE